MTTSKLSLQPAFTDTRKQGPPEADSPQPFLMVRRPHTPAWRSTFRWLRALMARLGLLFVQASR